MFTKTQEPVPGLTATIEETLIRMKTLPVTSDEWSALSAHLIELYKIRAENQPKTLSPDVMVSAAANLAGILLILNYERAHIVTSKALSFVLKLK